jgi:hypothetical protein
MKKERKKKKGEGKREKGCICVVLKEQLFLRRLLTFALRRDGWMEIDMVVGYWAVCFSMCAPPHTRL